jgi:hypothetical protein
MRYRHVDISRMESVYYRTNIVEIRVIMADILLG